MTALQNRWKCQRLLPNNSISRIKGPLYAGTNLQLVEHVFIILENPVRCVVYLHTDFYPTGLECWVFQVNVFNTHDNSNVDVRKVWHNNKYYHFFPLTCCILKFLLFTISTLLKSFFNSLSITILPFLRIRTYCI